jgi:predicted ester cyclase
MNPSHGSSEQGEKLRSRGGEVHTERNKAVVHRLFDEIWNGRKFEVVGELYAPDFVADYRPYAPLREGRDSIRGMVERAWTTMPDYHEDLLEMVAEGDSVAVHLRISGTQLGAWGPLPPTGKRLEFEEMLILTFNEAGQVVHQRGIVDNLAGLRQAGVMPTPEQ